jgi:hypothetical protein
VATNYQNTSIGLERTSHNGNVRVPMATFRFKFDKQVEINMKLKSMKVYIQEVNPRIEIEIRSSSVLQNSSISLKFSIFF